MAEVSCCHFYKQLSRGDIQPHGQRLGEGGGGGGERTGRRE